MELPRQLKPVTVTISGGDLEDRHWWATKLNSWLQFQPCETHLGATKEEKMIVIYPTAVND